MISLVRNSRNFWQLCNLNCKWMTLRVIALTTALSGCDHQLLLCYFTLVACMRSTLFNTSSGLIVKYNHHKTFTQYLCALFMYMQLRDNHWLPINDITLILEITWVYFGLLYQRITVYSSRAISFPMVDLQVLIVWVMWWIIGSWCGVYHNCSINGSVQDCSISSALALEILQSCTDYW